MKRPTERAGVPWSCVVAFGLCGCLGMPRTSSATERGSWEIGLDVAAEFATRDVVDTGFFSSSLVEVQTKAVDVPQGAFRAGYFLTDALSLEASLGMSWIISNPGSYVQDWQAQVGLGGTFALAPSAKVSPFLGSGIVARLSQEEFIGAAGYFQSNQRFGIPLEGGVRIRLGPHHSIRIQSGVIASFMAYESEGAFWTVPVRIGWSVNTKAASGGIPQ